MPTKISKPIIKYTARDFASIKEELINYAQKYYPEAYQDFNEASFGSLMVDMVSYIGDMLSFYIDYQANESFLETAVETNSVLKLSKQLGYKFRPNAASFGEIDLFVSIPAQIDAAAPDMDYAPIVRRGSVFKTSDNRAFTLVDDVDFSQSEDLVVAQSNADGTAPTHFAAKATGIAMSGELMTENFTIGNYQKFLTVEINDRFLTEVISVFDSEGNNYYEVDYLSQDTVYMPVVNTKEHKDTVRNILKPISVPRRFTTEQTFNKTVLQFGFGTANNEEKFLDPTNVILDVFGKNHIADKSFDPNVLIKTDKLGVPPSNTVLTVTYRRNAVADVNVSPGGLTGIVGADFKFFLESELDNDKKFAVQDSLEINNPRAITGDVANPTTTEIKLRSYGAYAAQNRAVTKDDYINLVYNMPSNFGQVKRANIIRDTDSFNGKNLNLYVMSVDRQGKYAQTNTVIKQNVKTWLSRYKLLGDTIDILDANIQNVQIFFTVVGMANINKQDVLESCIATLVSYYTDTYFDIGEPFRISDIYKLLNNVPSVLDTKDVTVLPVSEPGYSNYTLSYDDMISNDGRYLMPKENTVFEIKYPTSDIEGEVL